MDWFRGFWGRLSANVLTPKVSAEELDRHLQDARATLPTPVFWLLGKAQSGKTSIIRALTGSTRAEIGDGFRACTRTAQLYAFPSENDSLVNFLDTRGLGEANYDPAEDIQFCANQTHLLMVVVKAMDHAQEVVVNALSEAKRLHPEWPVIVVQTCLHEGYLAGMKHIEPYPFNESPFPQNVPMDLVRSLNAQRDVFAEFSSKFVPVDFTLPQDGLEPEHYGVVALWTAIEAVLPTGLRGILEHHEELRGPLRDAYFRTARPHILAYSLAAGAASAVPVPLVDIPLVLAIQTKMFHTIASIYEQPMDAKLIAEIGGSLGMGILARLGGRELAKFIPGVGMATASAYAAATTYALGCTLCAYFSYLRAGDVPDAAKIRELYASELEAGRKHMGDYLARMASHSKPTDEVKP